MVIAWRQLEKLRKVRPCSVGSRTTGQKSQGALVGDYLIDPRSIVGSALAARKKICLVVKQVKTACSRRRRGYRSSLEAIMALTD